jgi:hypothetical protein|tara:strand:- start:292 stop:423 length:132 start_codon:yes stop_codon:yes gene_type:complete
MKFKKPRCSLYRPTVMINQQDEKQKVIRRNAEIIAQYRKAQSS